MEVLKNAKSEQELELKPFGIEYLEPLEVVEARGGQGNCCPTFMSDISGGGDEGTWECTDVDGCWP